MLVLVLVVVVVVFLQRNYHPAWQIFRYIHQTKSIGCTILSIIKCAEFHLTPVCRSHIIVPLNHSLANWGNYHIISCSCLIALHHGPGMNHQSRNRSKHFMCRTETPAVSYCIDDWKIKGHMIRWCTMLCYSIVPLAVTVVVFRLIEYMDIRLWPDYRCLITNFHNEWRLNIILSHSLNIKNTVRKQLVIISHQLPL